MKFGRRRKYIVLQDFIPLEEQLTLERSILAGLGNRLRDTGRAGDFDLMADRFQPRNRLGIH